MSIFKNYWKPYVIEFKNEFSGSRKFLSIFIVAFALLPLIIMISTVSTPIGTKEIESQVNNFKFSLKLSFGQFLLYSTVLRVAMCFKDKSTLDKNRVLYLAYNKNQATLGKILGEISFCLFLYSTYFISVYFMTFINSNFKEAFSWKIAKTFLYAVPLLIVLNLFFIIGVKFLLARFESKISSGISIAIWLLSTVCSFIVLYFLMNSDVKDLTKFYQDNEKWARFVPLLNLGYVNMFLGDKFSVETISIIPIISSYLIIILFSWIWYPKYLKFYLCA